VPGSYRIVGSLSILPEPPPASAISLGDAEASWARAKTSGTGRT